MLSRVGNKRLLSFLTIDARFLSSKPAPDLDLVLQAEMVCAIGASSFIVRLSFTLRAQLTLSDRPSKFASSAHCSKV